MDFHQQVERPKYNAVLMALSNIIVVGAAYLVMHLYVRFFVTYALMFFVVIGATFVPAVGILGLLLAIIVIIDTFLQAKQITAGTKSAPQKKKGLNILGVIVIILFLIVYIGTQVMAQTRDPFTGRNLLQDIAKDRGNAAIHKKYPPLSDARCDAFYNDPTLQYDYYGRVNSAGYSFQEHCYVQKAVETGDPLYCGTRSGRDPKYTSGYVFDDTCITYLAVKNKQPELCTQMLEGLGSKNCSSAYKLGFADLRNACQSDWLWPENIRQRCASEFDPPIPPIEL